MRILIIEDNRDIAANLTDFLSARAHVIDVAGDGIGGLHLALTHDYDAIVLDLMLPGMDGLALCRKLRGEAGRQTPVLMLTARDSIDDKILGLEAGADDYVVKPYALREVEMRLKTISRRMQPQGLARTLRVGDLSYDLEIYRVMRGERRIELPPIPLKLLELLMRASPRLVARQAMEAAVWGDSPPDSDALKAHLHILRSAIDKPPDKPLLRTVRGIGYQIAADASA
ncbi:MAG: DNA-binding response regulator [Hydrogenophilales bacterium CG17_big_fil_post_rev_8_21_14_2_50_63_12]|nr:MAG: DNA-binding response regulator [Hydrogenophilales bacterium CG17_big_fil_post_rev_8_21_14_2_50_63_12]PIX95597.1 MAG: DNA-binding response regulator [Hydrogenophilales bacterium CG_4_10_14_3_um_filter_63_21]PJB04787.1 MAG: DNA-binding response regulator [Hydrogenophilales bacterium CG_4_9_14_3_um_filter_63_34]